MIPEPADNGVCQDREEYRISRAILGPAYTYVDVTAGNLLEEQLQHLDSFAVVYDCIRKFIS